MQIQKQMYRGGGILGNFFDKAHCSYIIFVTKGDILKIKDKWINEQGRKERKKGKEERTSCKSDSYNLGL